MIPPDAGDDEIGLYVGTGFGLTDQPSGIRPTGSTSDPAGVLFCVAPSRH